MWPDWLVVEWTLAALGCLVFWLLLVTEITDALRRHRGRHPRQPRDQWPYLHRQTTGQPRKHMPRRHRWRSRI
jgi:hypothetical protein